MLSGVEVKDTTAAALPMPLANHDATPMQVEARLAERDVQFASRSGSVGCMPQLAGRSGNAACLGRVPRLESTAAAP